MYEYRKSDDVDALMEIAIFSFTVEKSKHEFLRKYICTVLANGVGMYGVYDSNKLAAAHLLYPYRMRFRNS